MTPVHLSVSLKHEALPVKVSHVSEQKAKSLVLNPVNCTLLLITEYTEGTFRLILLKFCRGLLTILDDFE